MINCGHKAATTVQIPVNVPCKHGMSPRDQMSSRTRWWNWWLPAHSIAGRLKPIWRFCNSHETDRHNIQILEGVGLSFNPTADPILIQNVNHQRICPNFHLNGKMRWRNRRVQLNCFDVVLKSCFVYDGLHRRWIEREGQHMQVQWTMHQKPWT